ncbi:hypothetical protein NQ317_007104 [Molorchus minor]|uniref:Uncharacterized protein n=1 Tax=Molorchus minor TaxID=1323400 RepID=A0ABQ9K5J8_9CUCU|nr:hypothetical protein NQ317_007104 [Molorchus minor]
MHKIVHGILHIGIQAEVERLSNSTALKNGPEITIHITFWLHRGAVSSSFNSTLIIARLRDLEGFRSV